MFAISDIRLAAMYLATKGTAILMDVKTDKPRIVICSSPENYLPNDKGGAIYTVPANTFKQSPQEGLEDSEMVSGVSVKPISKKVYTTSLDAMKKMGITIYFVDENKFNKIVLAKNEDTIISGLKPFLH